MILQLKLEGFNDLVQIRLRSDPNVDFFVENLHRLNRPADEVGSYGNITWEDSIPDFLQHARRAKELFGFDWDLSQLTKENFHHWHRDIETLDIANHQPATDEKGIFFIQLHRALHRAEAVVALPQKTLPRMLYIKWYEPSMTWPSVPIYDHSEWQPGDVTLDYPHVGKSPLVCLVSGDNAKLQQACRLPDACPPGFHIQLIPGGQPMHDLQQKLTAWYDLHQDQLVSMFTKEDMLRYAGEFCIGRVIDLNQIPLLQKCKITGAQLVL
jgi:hypothetical protein